MSAARDAGRGSTDLETVEAAVAAAHGAEAVAPGVLRLPLATPTLPPATTTNHVLVGRHRGLVIDPATPLAAGQSQLVALCRALERDAGWRFHGLLLTHHHRDHVGGAAPIASALGLPIFAHPRTAALVAEALPRCLPVADGDDVGGALSGSGPGWRALHTPGHAPGHIALVHPAGGVVAGDLVAGEGTILIDPSDGDMALYLASLRRVLALPPTWLIPAHGPVLADGAAVLSATLAHRLAREARVLAALDDEARSDDALLPRAYGDVPRRTWPLALRSLRSHLWHLERQGLAMRDGERWRRAQPS